jgi:hypothetical protein
MTARHVVTGALLVALTSAGSLAQELDPRPFELQERFGAGEVWSTATAVRTRIGPVDHAVVSERSVGWTTSSVVREHGDGFELCSTLTAIMSGGREADVERVTVWREGQEGPWADPATRTWTVAFDRTWKALHAEGPARTVDRFLEDALRRVPLEGGPGERLAARLRARLLEDAGPALDAWVIEGLNELLAPVQAVLARLDVAGRLEVADTVPVIGGPGTPPGRVTYLGRGDGEFVFAVTWDTPAGQPLEGGFSLDPVGRLTSLVLRSGRVLTAPGERAVQLTREVVFEVILVRRPPTAPSPIESDTGSEEARPH